MSKSTPAASLKPNNTKREPCLSWMMTPRKRSQKNQSNKRKNHPNKKRRKKRRKVRKSKSRTQMNIWMILWLKIKRKKRLLEAKGFK